VPAKPPFVHGQGDVAKAEARILECFPGVNLDALRLLIACKGLIQRGDLIDVPQVFLTGQSGAGKSVHVHLAAQIACDRAALCRFTPDVQRFQQGYASASDECGFALFDEASKSGVGGKQLRDYCLMFAKGVRFHRLYCGPRSIDNPAVVVMTDPAIPDELLADEQTARRIAVVDLGAGVNAQEKVDWRETCGTGSVERWRAGEGNREHADVFLSDVIDRYFRYASWTFQKIAADLGFPLLRDLAAEEVEPELREIYTLCQAEAKQEWRGMTECVVVTLHGPGRLCELVTDAWDMDGQVIRAAKWGQITGKPSMTCRVKKHKNRVGIKFTPGTLPGPKPELSLLSPDVPELSTTQRVV
jgi:hypothetical protein